MPVRIKSSAGLPFGLPVPPAGWAQKPAGISLCMIVKNEERFLERCLSSARDAVDEIIVVDTGSTDRSIEIAQRFGARVERREWRDDFAWARNEAIALAGKRWILQLDADEELLEESKNALRTLRSAPAHLTGLWVRCLNRADQYLGSEGTLSHVIVRVFPNDERIRYYGSIHEFPSLDGACTTLPALGSTIKIVHHGYLNDVVNDREKFERNIRIIEEAVKRDPDDSFNWYNAGVTLHLAGRHEEAASALRRMWMLAQSHGMRVFVPNGLSLLADVLTDYLQAAEEGAEFALQALKLAPRYGNAHFSAGRAFAALGRNEQAREMFRAAIDDGEHLDRQYVADEDVPVWKAHNMIGGTYAAEGNDAEALRWFEAGLQNRPSVHPLRLNRAKALERLGRLQEAETALRELCEEFNDEQSVLNLVNFLLANNKPQDALLVIEQYRDACAPASAAALLLAAAAVEQRIAAGNGERYLRDAQALMPGSAEVLNPLEAIYRERGDDAAIAALRAAEAAVEPQQPADFARRAQLALAGGDAARALELAERGLLIAPSDSGIRYAAAVACVRLERKEEGLAHLDGIREVRDESYAHIEYLRALLLRDLNRSSEALQALERMLAAGPQIDALLLRASIAEALGDAGGAESAYLAALPLAQRRVAAELGAFYLRTGRFADAQRVAEEALA